MGYGIGRRSLLGAALLAPAVARAAPLPSFTQGRQSFVFLSPVRPAPDMNLPLTDGRHVRVLEPGSRRATILYFGATWCPPCRTELPEIERRLQAPGPHPRVVVIMMDEGGARIVTPYLQRNGLRRPVALDPLHSLARKTGAAQPGDAFVLWSLPISYVLSPDGRIVGYLPGAIDWSRPQARDFLRAVEAIG